MDPVDATAEQGAVASVSPPGPARRAFWAGLRANLIVGLRVFTLRRVPPSAIVSSFDQVAALLAIVLALAAVFDRTSAGADAEFAAYALYSWFAFLLFGMWLCALIARTLSDRADTRTVIVVALAVAPWALTLLWALSFVPPFSNDDSNAFPILVTAVLFVLAMLTARAAYGFLRLSTFIVVGASLFVVAGLQNHLYFDTHLWQPPADDAETDSTLWADAEAILFDQPGVIDEALEKLEPQRPGVPDIYYVGFGGDGFQRVFRREALLGEKVFAQRLGSGTRSLELINDRSDRDTFPLATTVGLRYALSQIGAAMDPKEDVLVLLLSSHGSAEEGISLRTGVLPVNSSLSPNDVRSALDDSGIRWRIIVVSACYAGVFLEPLKTDTTLIVTAADSENTSFGCADDRDLTYFGEAFLQNALPTAPSLQAAFVHAREEIAEREKQEQLTPSNPQMWVGASMAKKLEQLGPLPLGLHAP